MLVFRVLLHPGKGDRVERFLVTRPNLHLGSDCAIRTPCKGGTPSFAVKRGQLFSCQGIEERCEDTAAARSHGNIIPAESTDRDRGIVQETCR